MRGLIFIEYLYESGAIPGSLHMLSHLVLTGRGYR